MEHNSEERLETRVSRVEDIVEIQQLQQRYQQYLALFDYDGIMEQWSKHEDATMFHIDPSHYFKKFTEEKKNVPGFLVEHYAQGGVIEVAKDGKTAKATWFSPGIAINPEINGQYWVYGKYENDYIKEDGKWKLWHLDWLTTFMSDIQKGPLYDNNANMLIDAEKAVKGAILNKSRKPYAKDEIIRLTPEPPKPYDTWED